ncbi:MAG: winged helix DNA-binding domain-containing protein [Chitinophagaceae bacterium]|nr:MAG: winged helix DNA-binding domain-containing protein [Chitinophagaceae bacterium]
MAHDITTKEEIIQFRLLNQQLAFSKCKTVKSLLGLMGAMQAQDHAMCKWAVGIRLPGETERAVQQALDKGEILRTHLLRPTWHLVAVEDIYWLLELTAPQILLSMKFSQKQLGLTEATIAKSNRVIEQALTPDKHLTREVLVAELNNAKIRTDDYRSGHLFLHAELAGLICSGRMKGKEQTYALLEKRVLNKKPLNREEALAELARRYFSSHSPATLKDFAWWSGLQMKDARAGIEMTDKSLISVTIQSKTYWYSQRYAHPESVENTVLLLPAYDEFVISYKDRNVVLTAAHQKEAISSNGIFKPLILNKGQAMGIWKRVIKKDTVTLEMEFFRPPSRADRKRIEEAAEAYGKFLEKKVVIR